MRGAYIVLALSGLIAAHSVDAVTREERGNLVLEDIPALEPALAERMDDWLAARGATLVDFLADGALLVSTRFGEAEQLHRVARPGAMREQLTFFAEPVTLGRASRAPDGGFVFLKDRGGDENHQLYHYSLADRSIQLLTDGRSLNGSPTWSRDGRRVAWYGNSRNPAIFDVFIRDIPGSGPPITLVAGDDATYYPLEWSADGQQLLLWNPVSISESRLYLFDLRSRALTRLDPPRDVVTTVVRDPLSGKVTRVPARHPPVAITAARFAKDGRGVYLISDHSSEFAQLRFLDLRTGDASVSMSRHIPWDVEQLDVSADGRWLAYTYNEDGYSRLQLLDLENSQELQPPRLPDGVIANLRFDPASQRLGMTLSGPDRPRDVWTLELQSLDLTRWTASESGPVAPARYVQAQTIRYPTFDTVGRRRPRQIPALVHRPRTPGRHPVVIDIHGGPESQARPGFDATTQFLVGELGYAVIAPNVRGSTGYGKTYTALDNGYLRENAVRDIGALIDWIATQPDLDPQRVVVMGASYGGYMALASLVAYGDRLRGGIDIVGISDFVTFLENTANYRQDLRRVEYGDERDPKMRLFLRNISPRTYARSIRRPLLVVQGLNDPRVPASESAQMVAAIREHGGEVWYLAAKDEGHGFRKKANRDAYLKTMAMFLKRLTSRT